MSKTVKTMVITEVTTRHYEPQWFKRDFCRMSEEFKRGRSGFKEKFNRCFGCNWPFQVGTNEDDGEITHIVHFKSVGNKLICTDCLNKLFGDKANLEYWNKNND